jgi:hypothetical protein
MTRLVMALFVLATLAMLAGAPAVRAAEGLSLDLNKLEPQGGSCRVTLVVVNGRPAAVEALKADLVIFGSDGVVARRLAVDLGRIAAEKTVVRVFEIPALGCEAVGSVLLNDLPTCRVEGETTATADCLSATTLTARVGRLFK